MSDIRIGDKIKAVDSRGFGFWDEVYFFGHADERAFGQFLQVELDGADGTKLQLTHRHFLPGCLRGLRCSWPERVEEYAQNFQPGDYIWIMHGIGEHSQMEQRKIVNISRVESTGLFNPYTLSGTLVVNNVVSSSHSDWILDNFLPAAYVPWLPSIYQRLFFPGRVLYFFLRLAGDTTMDLVVNDILDVNSPQSQENGNGPAFLAVSFLCLFLLLAQLQDFLTNKRGKIWITHAQASQ